MLLVNTRLCTGCRNCELACALARGAPGALAPSRVHVASEAPLHASLLCLQCEEAACARACPVRALVRNEATGAIELISSRCNRCEMCVTACPFGNISITPTHGILKCDLCGGDPACARFCPSGALRLSTARAEETVHGPA